MGMGRYLLRRKNLVNSKIKRSRFLLSLFFLVLFFSAFDVQAFAKSSESQVEFFLTNLKRSDFFYAQRNTLHGKILVPYEYPLLVKFRNRYLNPNGLKYLQTIMQRSTPYRNFIINELRKENLPIELLFLPVIESGYSTKAVSRSGAVGVWQFMRNSIGGYNIHINEWADERRDPWKSSVAAVKKLKWNYDYYKDWYLALAAYNCGVGGLNKAIKRGKSRDYWYLAEHGYLKKETALYVAKFLAISQILRQSEKYGIDWGLADELASTETVKLDRSVDLILLSEELNLDKDNLRALNPSLRYNITPPDTKYDLRLPVGNKESVEKLLKSKKILIRHYRYTVKSGDTLYALALHYGVSVKTILNYNPGISARSLQIGQKLLIPALKSVATYKGKKSSKKIALKAKYKVKKGDTLWSIALKYNIPVEILAEKNGLTVNSILSLGKVLKVPIQE